MERKEDEDNALNISVVHLNLDYDDDEMSYPIETNLWDPGTIPALEKIVTLLVFLVVFACPVFLLCCFRVVKQYERAVMFRNGRIRSRNPVGPGLIFYLPCIDDIFLVDTRTQSMDLNPQEILTKDSVTVTVNAIIYFYIMSPINCALNIRNFRYATELLAISVLRNAVGLYDLATVLSNRETLGFQVQKLMGQATMQWGMEVERIVIREIILPVDLQKAMAAEAEGTRLAQAKIIESEGEIKAAESLKEAADILTENPQALLLRYLQTLNFIASNNKSSIVFPFPLDMPLPGK